MTESFTLTIEASYHRFHDTPRAPVDNSAAVNRELVDRFLEQYVPVHCKPWTCVEYEHTALRYILPALGPVSVLALARHNVATLHHELRDKSHQANRTLGMLS